MSSRFVDYFVICGYDHTKGRSGNPKESHSQVIQRFPERDWPDIAFIHGLDLFCQPNGWLLTPERQEPKFFVSILTDAEGNRLYCPCLSFSEAISKDKLGLATVDEDNEDDGHQGPLSIVTVRGSTLPRHVVPGVSLPTGASGNIFMYPQKYFYSKTFYTKNICRPGRRGDVRPQVPGAGVQARYGRNLPQLPGPYLHGEELEKKYLSQH